MPVTSLPAPAIAWARAATPALFQAVDLNLHGISSGETFGHVNVGIEQFLTAVAITTGVALGIPDVILSGQTLAPAGIASGEAFGALTAGQFPSQYVSHAGAIASTAAFGVATASHSGAATISPVGIPSAEAFG